VDNVSFMEPELPDRSSLRGSQLLASYVSSATPTNAVRLNLHMYLLPKRSTYKIILSSDFNKKKAKAISSVKSNLKNLRLNLWFFKME